MARRFLMVWLLCALTGCSALAPVSKGYLQANVAAYEALPAAVQQAYPTFLQSVYFSASVLVTRPDDWRLQLHSPHPLVLPAQVPVWLRYQLNGEHYALLTQWQGEKVAHAEPQAARPYVYVLSPLTAIADSSFWQRYQQQRWAGDKPKFDYFLQPELGTDTQQIELRFQLARHGGFLSAGAFARKMLKGTDEMLAQLCQGNQYRYRRASACGSVQIRELAAASQSTVNPATH